MAPRVFQVLLNHPSQEVSILQLLFYASLDQRSVPLRVLPVRISAAVVQGANVLLTRKSALLGFTSNRTLEPRQEESVAIPRLKLRRVECRDAKARFDARGSRGAVSQRDARSERGGAKTS